jgi:Tfp pilus assembly protein PilF
MKLLHAILGSVLVSATLWAGAVVTIDGQRVEGDLKKTPDGWRVTLPDGQVRNIANADVRAIELTSTGTNNQMERLNSLRRSVETLEDIAKVLERYDRFLEQTKDPAVLEAAGADIKIWVDRRDRGLVKSGKQWVTRQDRQQIVIELLRRIEAARQQIKAGDTRSAQANIDSILKDDPGNVSAVYLQGVILQQQEKVPEARKAFDAAREAIPDHPPTLHNIAVLAMRQRQWAVAAAALDQAMTAAPGIQVLVDASAELLNALPDDQKKAPAVQKLAKRFSEQDAALQTRMAEKQMFRWGGKWVDKTTHEKLIEAEKAVKVRIDELQGDFDLTQNRIDRIDAEISQNERTMRDIERRSYMLTADGTYIRVPLPGAYYDFQRDNVRLSGERREMNSRLELLREAAKRAQADLPVPKFIGSIQAIGEDGVPIVIPEGVDPSVLRGDRPPGPTPDPATSQPAPPPPPIIRIGPGGEG